MKEYTEYFGDFRVVVVDFSDTYSRSDFRREARLKAEEIRKNPALMPKGCDGHTVLVFP